MYGDIPNGFKELGTPEKDLEAIISILKMGINCQRRRLGRLARKSYTESLTYSMKTNRLDLALGSVKTGVYIGLSNSLNALHHVMSIVVFFENYINANTEDM